MVGCDDDRDQRVVQGLINVGHVLGILREPGAGRNDAEADPVGGYVVEQAEQVGAVHTHPRVADINELVSHTQPEPIGGERDLRPLALNLAGRLIGGHGRDANVGDGGQVAR